MRSFRELVLSVTLILPLLATRLQQGRVLFFFFRGFIGRKRKQQ